LEALFICLDVALAKNLQGYLVAVSRNDLEASILKLSTLKFGDIID
jgi:hypothetical protein